MEYILNNLNAPGFKLLKNGTFSVDSVSVYEHPYIASGMRIAGTNGKAYTPAETVFHPLLEFFIRG